MDAGLQKAIATKPSIAAFASALGLTRAAVCPWKKIPAERVVQVEKITGVKREHLRPDLYLRAEASAR